MEYFNAREARKISEDIRAGKMNEELDYVYEYIRKATLKGVNQVTIDKFLMESTEAFLRSKGYNIKRFYGVQWDPATDTTISW